MEMSIKDFKVLQKTVLENHNDFQVLQVYFLSNNKSIIWKSEFLS